MIIYFSLILPNMWGNRVIREMWILAGAEVIMLDAPIIAGILLGFLRGVGLYG